MNSRPEILNPKLSVLLVEDNPGDAHLIRHMLVQHPQGRFVLAHEETLSASLKRLLDGGIDVVLLDLSLPDCEGLDTFLKTHACAPATPVVVLTGTDNEDLATQAMREGAQDYLLKGQVDSHLLTRSIRYAVERQHLLTALEKERQEKQQEKEMHFFERLSALRQSVVTSRHFGIAPLRENVPETFQQLVQRYGNLMDWALEQRSFKVDRKISEELRAMAEQLGFLKAGPRDVVEIHSTSLKNKTTGAVPQKAQAYVEEARLMILELMGYLAAHYRTHALGK